MDHPGIEADHLLNNDKTKQNLTARLRTMRATNYFYTDVKQYFRSSTKGSIAVLEVAAILNPSLTKEPRVLFAFVRKSLTTL